MVDISVILPVVISLAGVIVSIITSSFIAGTHTGKSDQKLDDITQRLAKIEGMFTLRLRQPGGDS